MHRALDYFRFHSTMATMRENVNTVVPQELDVNMFYVLVYPLRSKGKDGHSAAAHIVSG